MKRPLAYILSGVALVALFVWIVYIILVASDLSEPAAETVDGPTLRRIWALIVALLALTGVIIGTRSLRRYSKPAGKKNAVFALTAGSIAVINGIINLATANGGPGTGNGVVGAAAAFVLGLIAVILGWVALSRFKRNNQNS